VKTGEKVGWRSVVGVTTERGGSNRGVGLNQQSPGSTSPVLVKRSVGRWLRGAGDLHPAALFVVGVHPEHTPLEPCRQPGLTPALLLCSLILNVLHQLCVFLTLLKNQPVPVAFLF